MKEENQIKLVKIGAGCFLALLHVVTGVNGIILLMAAFLFGIPLEEVFKRQNKP